MALLDVSDIPMDPDFASSFEVVRRVEAVNDFGEATTRDSVQKGIIGTITMASPNDLLRFDDHQLMDKVISVVTRFRLRGPSPGYQPDVVRWHDSDFVVKTVEPYTHFGRGFVQAIAASMKMLDAAPQAAPGEC